MTCCGEWGDRFDDKVCCRDDDYEKANERDDGGKEESNDRDDSSNKNDGKVDGGDGGDGGGKDSDDSSPAVFLQGFSNGQENSPSNDLRN
jgi:hypothetical protein